MRALTRARTRGGIAMAVVAGSLVAGCSTAEPPPEPPLSVLRVPAPLHAPIWSSAGGAVVALTDDERVARVAPRIDAGAGGVTVTAETAVSAPFLDVGENLSPGFDRDVVYLPQPRLGHAAVVDARTLQSVGALPVGPAPAYLDLDVGSATLLALSADRSRVTGIDLHDNEVNTSETIDRNPPTKVDGGQRGRRIGYYLSGPAGVAFYEGSPFAVREEGRLPLPAGEATRDRIKSSRLYVAERDNPRLTVVDRARALDGIEETGHADLDGPARHLAVDDTRLYVVTDHTFTVFETESFTGYRDDTVPLAERFEIDRLLPPALRGTPVSGLTVGPTRAYLTLQGRPFVVAVAKPDL